MDVVVVIDMGVDFDLDLDLDFDCDLDLNRIPTRNPREFGLSPRGWIRQEVAREALDPPTHGDVRGRGHRRLRLGAAGGRQAAPPPVSAGPPARATSTG